MEAAGRGLLNRNRNFLLSNDWARARWLRTGLRVLPVLLVVLMFNVTGFRGVNFGEQWDELHWHVKPARDMIETGLLIPREYVYPTFERWLILVPSIPAGVRAWIDSEGDPKRIQQAMLGAIDTGYYLLNVRRAFIFVSSLAILWVYLAALALRHRWWQALAAATSLALSWEFAYHARWVVPDSLLVQFSALTLFMLACFRRTTKPVWLYAAAVAAGLGTGTKYPGVFLLMPVLLASVVSIDVKNVFQRVVRSGLLCATAFTAYIVTSPGTLLDPFTFIEQTRWISNYYSKGHGGYTVASGWEHGGKVLAYLGITFFSPSRVLAGVLFTGVLAGGFLWIRRQPRFGAVLLCLPVVFLLYFCSKYRVVTARNYLFLTPFLAILLAMSVAEVQRRVSNTWVRRSLAAALVIAFSAQAIWLIGAAESIRRVNPKVYARQAIEYIREHPKDRFRVSEHVRALAADQKLALPPNITRGQDATHVVFLGRQEGPDPWIWKTNDPWLTDAIFGPRDMNFNWYSTWVGHDRIVVMTITKARETKVALAK